MNGKATQHLASRVTPDLIGGPAATVGSGCPIESGMTIGGSSSVTPDLIGGPAATVGPGCPIKSGMTMAGTSPVTPDSIRGPVSRVGPGCPIESGMTMAGTSPVTPALSRGPVSTMGSGCLIKSGMTGGASGMTVSGVELLYRDQYPAVHHMLQRRVGNPEDAADLAQEAFLRLMRYDNHSLESLRFLVMTQ